MNKLELLPSYNDVVKPLGTTEFQIRSIQDNDFLYITIQNRYIGKLPIMKKWRKIFGGVISITINNHLHYTDKNLFYQHLDVLNLASQSHLSNSSNTETKNYNTIISFLNKETLSNFQDRVWRHLSPKLSLKLTEEFYDAVMRNDFAFAMDRIKQGTTLNHFFILNCGLNYRLFLQEPTPKKVCDYFWKVTPIKTTSSSRFVDVQCIQYSPLSLVLTKEKVDIQKEQRIELTNLLKAWGTSYGKATITYSLYISQFDGQMTLDFSSRSISTNK